MSGSIKVAEGYESKFSTTIEDLYCFAIRPRRDKLLAVGRENRATRHGPQDRISQGRGERPKPRSGRGPRCLRKIAALRAKKVEMYDHQIRREMETDGHRPANRSAAKQKEAEARSD